VEALWGAWRSANGQGWFKGRPMLRSSLIGLVAAFALLAIPTLAQAGPAEEPAVIAGPAAASSDDGFFSPITEPLTALVDLLSGPFRSTPAEPLAPSIFAVGRLSGVELPVAPSSQPYFRSGWRNGVDIGLAAITWNRVDIARRDLSVPVTPGTRRPWTQLDMPALGLSAYFRF
jgi:hypothetical protein